MHEYFARNCTSKDFDPIRDEECDELSTRASQGDQEAKTRLIKSCMRFAFICALKWWKKNPTICFDDFMQEAFMGLCEAADKINPERRQVHNVCFHIHLQES